MGISVTDPQWTLVWIGHTLPTPQQIEAARRQDYALIPVDVPDPLAITADDIAAMPVAQLPNFEGVATHSIYIAVRQAHRYQVCEFVGAKIAYHDGRSGPLKGTPYL